jgi:hypothetical protein
MKRSCFRSGARKSADSFCPALARAVRWNFVRGSNRFAVVDRGETEFLYIFYE